MIPFWSTLVVLACVTTVLVVWPLVRRPKAAWSAGANAAAAPTDLDSDQAKRLAVYRDRRLEIDAELRAGRLTADEAARAQEELLADVAGQFPTDALAAPSPAAARPPWALIALIALAIPVTAVLVYDRVGSPGVVALDAAELRGDVSPAKLDAALDELRERTRAKPTDGEAWAMLAEGLRMKGDLAGSVAAFEQAAVHFKPPSARLLADYADTLISLKQGVFGPEAVQLIEGALAIDPKEPKALALKGAAQYRNGDLPGALATLRRLREQLPPDSAQAASIGEAIGRIEASLGSGHPGTAATGPAPAQTPTAPATAPAPRTSVLAGRIEIDPSLATKAPAGTTLFIVVRPADGSRMPLAARKVTLDRFPMVFELGDDDAMDASRKPSAASSLVVEARLSRSGNATRASGDLFGVSAPTAPGRNDIRIRIDQVVP